MLTNPDLLSNILKFTTFYLRICLHFAMVALFLPTDFAFSKYLTQSKTIIQNSVMYMINSILILLSSISCPTPSFRSLRSLPNWTFFKVKIFELKQVRHRKPYVLGKRASLFISLYKIPKVLLQ